MRLHVVLFAVTVLFASMPRSVADEPSPEKGFANSTGWVWIIDPFPTVDDVQENMRSNKGMVLFAEEGKNQELIVVIARPWLPQTRERQFYSWRPIAFDADGQQCKLRPRVAMGGAMRAGDYGSMMERWGSDPSQLAADRIAYVGLEGLTAEGFRAMSDAAAAKAKGKGLDVLPFPVVGASYPFRLKNLTGNIIDSRELQGKVVLLDFWATWCLPCMQKLPKLKDLYARWHDDGFEVVGINFDDGQATLTKTVEELGLPWPQTMGPTDEELRELWWDAMGLEVLPRLLIIDRHGVLRADCRPDELEKHVTALMADQGLLQDP